MSTPQQIASSEQATIRSLPIGFWPEADRNAWSSASRPSQRLKRGGAGSHMKQITLDDLARRYGYFLDCMNRRGLLDPNRTAGGHVTPENVDAYLAELAARVGSVTIQGSIHKLRRACELIDPARDMSWLADIEKDLALVMQPRSKARVASAMRATRVAMLAMHPVRLKNFADLEVGRNFIEIKGSWWIALSASETKEGRPDERRIDDLLEPALDRYLKKYRPILAGADQSTRALWLSSNDGASMSYAGVERVLTETTRTTVGIAVSPHLFRTAIASSAAIHGGANPHLASALLHHTDAHVTEAHYNRASSISAGDSLRSIIQEYIKD